MSKRSFRDLSYEQRAEYASRIKLLRQAADVTQAELGFETGVSRATIINWENGSSVPQADKLEDVFRALGVPNDEKHELDAGIDAWLAAMGALMERVPDASRQPAMNDAMRSVASHVGPIADDDFEFTARPPKQSELDLASKRGRKKIDE